MSKNLDEETMQTGKPLCTDLPNEAEEHYWAWSNSPKSTPTQYRHCMICNRIDASEAIKRLIAQEKLEELKHLRDLPSIVVHGSILNRIAKLEKELESE